MFETSVRGQNCKLTLMLFRFNLLEREYCWLETLRAYDITRKILG